MLKLSGFEGDTGIDCRIPPGGDGGGRGGGRGPDACSCDASNCRDNGTLSCCCTEGILISFNPYGTGMGCGIPPGGGGGGCGPDACSCDASGGVVVQATVLRESQSVVLALDRAIWL